MLCSNSGRLASPDLRALSATAAPSLPDPTAVPIATACPMLKKICTVDSVECEACSNLSNRASRSGVEIGGERAQGGRLEHVDAKSALGGGGHGVELLIGKTRRRVRREQFPNMRRHRTQGGAHLFAHRGILIDLRRGLDIDGRLRGIQAGGQEHQYCKTKHGRTPSDCQSGTIVHSGPCGAGGSEVSMGWLKGLTISASVLFIVSCASPEPPPPKKTVFDPLTQQLDRARDVQKTVDQHAD